LINELRQLQPAGPYHLVGASFGGLVAFQAARLLVQQGQDVAFLGIIDTRGPGFPTIVTSKHERLRRKFRQWITRPASHWRDRVSLRLKWIALRSSALVSSLFRPNDQPVKVDYAPEYRRQSMAYLARLPRYPGRLTLFRCENQYFHPAYEYGDI